MALMRRYNVINNLVGWAVFFVALVTYLLTVEPSASLWDCTEYTAQAYKLGIGHPPGNPVWMLFGRFFANFAFGDVTMVARCLNVMSALMSAATILLLFWTITHFVKKAFVRRGEEDNMTTAQLVTVMGSGVAGALAYAWSDSFWFSAVEAEVYAFSSFCTALVFWLAIKWENRADQPYSDRYLLLIAYVMGLSLGVHLLNLLCLPAVGLVIYYRRAPRPKFWGVLATVGVSFAAIVLILYGMMRGYLVQASALELFAVNTLGMPVNGGLLLYTFVFLAVLAVAVWVIYTRSQLAGMAALTVVVALSGAFALGRSWVVPAALLVVFAVAMWLMRKHLSRRMLANMALSLALVFTGFCSYALVLIRANANLTLEETKPSDVFALLDYLGREQYGKAPLLYGETFTSIKVKDEQGNYRQTVKTDYAPKVDGSGYVANEHYDDYVYAPEQNMVFPRMHSASTAEYYRDWAGVYQGTEVEATSVTDDEGNTVETEWVEQPTYLDNFLFFANYQVFQMYLRYFLWNFMGRQNDIPPIYPYGGLSSGNAITGFNAVDNLILPDQSALPDEYGAENRGHNVYYCLPLLLGILGVVWHARRRRGGIRDVYVVMWLFVMTGVAIVVYLNQAPAQARDRDYAFVGSFYAFSIWLGMGVAALASLLRRLLRRWRDSRRRGMATAVAASVAGLAVAGQMLSQTYDDHDRSGRMIAHDFAWNMLASTDPNAVIVCSRDNDVFPLWYLQEVEGYRTDVRVIHQSYVGAQWGVEQLKLAAYDSPPLHLTADDLAFAYGNRLRADVKNGATVDAVEALRAFYAQSADYQNIATISRSVSIGVTPEQAVAAGLVPQRHAAEVKPITYDLCADGYLPSDTKLVVLDILATQAADGWNRPVYFTSITENYDLLGFKNNLRLTGVVKQVTPWRNDGDRDASLTDKMYRNVTQHFRWGGLDAGDVYLDLKCREIVNLTRRNLMTLVSDLLAEADEGGDAWRADRLAKALTVLDLMCEKLPVRACPLPGLLGRDIALAYAKIAESTGDASALERGEAILDHEIDRYNQFMHYFAAMKPWQREQLSYEEQLIYSGAPDTPGSTGYMPQLEAAKAKINRIQAELRR